jgi:hypothetical protein
LRLPLTMMHRASVAVGDTGRAPSGAEIPIPIPPGRPRWPTSPSCILGEAASGPGKDTVTDRTLQKCSKWSHIPLFCVYRASQSAAGHSHAKLGRRASQLRAPPLTATTPPDDQDFRRAAPQQINKHCMHAPTVQGATRNVAARRTVRAARIVAARRTVAAHARQALCRWRRTRHEPSRCAATPYRPHICVRPHPTLERAHGL